VNLLAAVVARGRCCNIVCVRCYMYGERLAVRVTQLCFREEDKAHKRVGSGVAILGAAITMHAPWLTCSGAHCKRRERTLDCAKLWRCD
jgi:hypothetical protein